MVSWRGVGIVIGISLLSVVCLAINPYTTKMWTYYLDTVGIGALRDFIEEWRSPDFHPLHTQPFIWLLLGTLGVMGLSGRRADGSDLMLVGTFAYASLMAGRNFGPFALVAAPVLSRHVSAILTRWGWTSRQRPRAVGRLSTVLSVVNIVLLIVCVGLAVVKIRTPLSSAFNEWQQRESLPVEAASWIRENRPEGEMFNPYNWGGYLIWSLYPDHRVFVDGRTDLYGDVFLHEYLKVQYARPGFEQILTDYDVNLVLTYPDDPLAAQLACSGGWREGYRDDVAAVWVREGSGRK